MEERLTVGVSGLVDLLSVADATIRRDIGALGKEGLVKRVRGDGSNVAASRRQSSGDRSLSGWRGRQLDPRIDVSQISFVGIYAPSGSEQLLDGWREPSAMHYLNTAYRSAQLSNSTLHHIGEL